jgi:hypothetical protein
VAWRSGDGNIGWAPLFPGAEWTGADYNCPADWWVFLHAKYFYLPRYFNVWRGDVFNGPRHTRKLLSETGIDANTYQNGDSKYYSGPLAATVHQITKQPVKIYKLTIATVRGNDSVTGNTVNIYQAKRMPGESPENQSAHPAFANMVEAPEPIRRPEEIHLKWNQQRPFKEFLQRINPMWNPQFIRDSPPYYNFPREQSMFGN